MGLKFLALLSDDLKPPDVPVEAKPETAPPPEKKGLFSRLWSSKKAPAPVQVTKPAAPEGIAPIQETKPEAPEGGRKTPEVPGPEQPGWKEAVDPHSAGKRSGRNTPEIPTVEHPTLNVTGEPFSAGKKSPFQFGFTVALILGAL
ncbi:uncharacterized protein LOC144102749 [Amblyomma americanum]